MSVPYCSFSPRGACSKREIGPTRPQESSGNPSLKGSADGPLPGPPQTGPDNCFFQKKALTVKFREISVKTSYTNDEDMKEIARFLHTKFPDAKIEVNDDQGNSFPK